MSRSIARTYFGLFLLFSVSFAAGRDCSLSSPLLTSSDANTLLKDCTNITSDVIVGDPTCTGGCTLSSLQIAADSVVEISGSLVIRCCDGLTFIGGWNALETIRGSLIIEANMEVLAVVNAFIALTRLDGSLIIRQNGALTSVRAAFSVLERIGGYINIERNRKLTDVSGLATLSVIEGNQLIGGSALSVLFNPALEDMAWLTRLTNIENGVVHIEGNTGLCYAGYPQWGTFGSFFGRSGVQGEDQGIDWRTLIHSSANWEYMWTDMNIPSLVVKDNAASETCASASCHSSCPVGAGCLGPRSASLCGSCQPLPTGGDTCQFNASQAVLSGDVCSLWPPAGTVLWLWVGLFVSGALLIVMVIVMVMAAILCVCCKGERKKSKDTFQVGFTQSNPASGAVALSPPSRDSSGMVLLKHKTTTTDFLPSVDGQVGGNIPWGMQKNMRHSLMLEPFPTADSYTSDHKADHLGQEEVPHHLMGGKDDPQPSTPPHTPTKGEPLEGTSHRTSNVSSIADLEAGEDLRASPPRVDLSTSVATATSSSSISSSAPLINSYDQLIPDFHQEVPMHFPSNQIKACKDIGTASFGKVYVADARRLVKGLKKSTVVVKQLKEGASASEKNTFLKPVSALKSMKHRNVLALLGVCQETNAVMLLLEHCSEGNLKTFLVRHQWEQQSLKQRGLVFTMACDMARGVAYLHSISVAHNDLACRNCLVTGNHVVKIGDYGLSKEIFKEDYYSRQPDQTPLPIRWMAPELIHIGEDDVLSANGSTLSGNVWSLGVTLWEMCSFASWPYEDMLNEEVIEHVKSNPKCVLENPDEGGLLQDMYPLMQKCWEPAEARPLASEVLQLLMILREDFKGTGKKRAVTPPPPVATTPSQQQQMEPTAATITTSKSHDHFTDPPASQHTKKAKITKVHEQEGRRGKANPGLKRKAHSSDQLDHSAQTEEEGTKSTTDQPVVPKSNLRSSSSERSLTEKRVSFKDFATDNENDDVPQVVYSEDVAALIW